MVATVLLHRSVPATPQECTKDCTTESTCSGDDSDSTVTPLHSKADTALPTLEGFVKAAETGDVAAVELGIAFAKDSNDKLSDKSNNFDINATNSMGYNALHSACNHKHAAVVRALLEAHADVNGVTNDNMWWTPVLITAFFNGSLPVMRLLCDAKAAVNSTTVDGDTALHFLAFQDEALWPGGMDDRVAMARELLDHGALPSIQRKNHHGETAVGYACVRRRCGLVNYYLETEAMLSLTCSSLAEWQQRCRVSLLEHIHVHPLLDIIIAYVI